VLLRKGNGKLGESLIWGFGLPSVTTCPGASAVCVQVCYSKRLESFRVEMHRAYERNLEATKQPDFVRRILGQIDADRVRIVRVHTAGDFYALAYLAKWVRIFRARPDVTFYFYTRSWRVEGFGPLLAKAARLKNVRQWWSVDAGTGWPDEVPPGVRLAYLVTKKGEEPGESHLVFRTQWLRREPARTLGGVVVCPAENGEAKVPCERCGYCFSPADGMRGRVALALV
jgi:hypothetical protein